MAVPPDRQPTRPVSRVDRSDHVATDAEAERRGLLSVVTPAFNEAENLPVLYERLSQVLGSLELEWEWIVVDDHSGDETFAVIGEIAKRDPRVHGIRLARNCGSHAATACGLEHARGDAAVVMAGDLQDPPEVLPGLVSQWRGGAQVVWAVRARREGERLSRVALAGIYYFLMRRVVGMKEMPATGADFFLIDRQVIDALRQFSERNVSILALITWMGFHQTTIAYDRQARLHGRSGWSLEKKLKLLLDSIISFTYLPVRMMSYFGLVVLLIGVLYTGVTVANAVSGRAVEGWSWLMAVVLILAGGHILMMGVLGEYVWRALDEARHRPRYLIEATTDSSMPGR